MGEWTDKAIELAAKALVFIAKPLYFRANVKPTIRKAAKHLRTKYDAASLENPTFNIKIGEGEPTLEHGIYKVYIPPGELFRKLNENREAMLIQNYMQNALAPDLQIIDKPFHDAVCISATAAVLEKDKEARTKIIHYYRQINEKNKDNTYLEPVAAASESGALKLLLAKISKTVAQDRKKTGRITTATRRAVKKHIQVEKNKWKRQIENTEKLLDTQSDEELIKGASKSILDHTKRHTAASVVESIVKQKPLRTSDGKLLSYQMVAEAVWNNTRISSGGLAKLLGKPEIAYIQYGIISLLNHKNGLDLIQRKKVGASYRLYPSARFTELMKKHNYKANQRNLSEYA